MDKLTEMRVFVAAARRGSFSGAARQLHMSPSAVSKLITRLEERIGARLFNRSTRRVNLTEGGEVFLYRCVKILDDLEDAEDLLAGYGREPRGVLTISSTSGFARYCLLPLLPNFQREYPQLNVDLRVSGQVVDLVSEGVDLAIRLGELKDNRLVARKLYESPRIICASPDYLAVNGKPERPSDLETHNCLRLSTAPAFNRWTLNAGRTRKAIDVSGDFITDNVEILHQHAVQGGGIVRLSGFMVTEDLQAGRLVPLLEKYNQEVQQVHAVFPHREHLPSKVRVMLDYLGKHPT